MYGIRVAGKLQRFVDKVGLMPQLFLKTSCLHFFRALDEGHYSDEARNSCARAAKFPRCSLWLRVLVSSQQRSGVGVQGAVAGSESEPLVGFPLGSACVLPCPVI